MFDYLDFTMPYIGLIDDVKSRLERSNMLLNKQLGYAPIESVKSRIKKEESTRKKLEKKGLAWTEENIKKQTDLAGIRVICKFIDDIPEILSLIKSWEKFKLGNARDGTGKFSYEQVAIVEEQDFVGKPKESGYRSYHVVCKKGNLFFEIQIRTISMDFWAATEHLLKYKYKDDLPDDVREKLKSIADISSTLDMAMNDIRQDVNLGTAKSRLLEQLYLAIELLSKTGLAYKADAYREQLKAVHTDLDALKSLAIRAKEDVPPGYWKDQP